MLLLAILLPGVSLIINGRIIGGLIAIILQIIACLTFVLFGLGFVLWLILVIWAINARSNVKTEKRLKKMERRISVNQLILNEQEQTFSAQQQPKEEKIIEETTSKIENPKKETKSDFLLFMGFISKHKKPILLFGIPIIVVLIATKLIISYLSFDFADPKEVVVRAQKLWYDGDYKNFYKHLTEETQLSYQSSDNYTKLMGLPDSVRKKLQLISIKAEEMPNKNLYFYKRYKLTKKILKGSDTITDIFYQTLRNINKQWKITGTYKIRTQASEHFARGDFHKARELYYSAIEIDPFAISERNNIVWCYIRDTINYEKWQDTAAYHLNYLLELDSTNGDTYNTVGAYYSSLNEKEKAVKYFLLSAKYELDSSSIADEYSNAAQSAKGYSFPKAEKYLKISLGYFDKSYFTWKTYGDILYSQNDFSNAKEKYEKAIKLVASAKGVDNYVLIDLYGYYVIVCKKLGFKEKAEEYTLKCIRVYPDKKHPVFKLLNL